MTRSLIVAGLLVTIAPATAQVSTMPAPVTLPSTGAGPTARPTAIRSTRVVGPRRATRSRASTPAPRPVVSPTTR